MVPASLRFHAPRSRDASNLGDVLYSAELAAEFLAAYEAEAGRRVDPYWDISCVTAPAVEDWTQFIPIQVGGRIPFGAAGMTARVDALLTAALRRL